MASMGVMPKKVGSKLSSSPSRKYPPATLKLPGRSKSSWKWASMLKRLGGTFGVWADPFLTSRSHNLGAESIDPGRRQAKSTQSVGLHSAYWHLPMPTMAIGSSMESSELWVFSSMYGILTDVSILALTFDLCEIDFDCR